MYMEPLNDNYPELNFVDEEGFKEKKREMATRY